jgi:hypothetical protein
MGSCFARNIEQHLANAGYEMPSRILVDEIAGIGNANIHIHNKYNPVSMLQEIKWAFGLESSPEEGNRFIQISDDKFIDLYLHMEPANRSECSWLSNKATELFKSAINCRVYVITLGLVEVWLDNETGLVINEPQNLIKCLRKDESLAASWNKRFKFQLLSYEELEDATRKLLDIIGGAGDAKVILTVSPVPLAGTFTGKDVVLANMYSKSVLRAVAESVSASMDFVDYFPSYESIMLSSKKEVWQSDGIHVLDSVVEYNVKAMLESYIPPEDKTSIFQKLQLFIQR